MDMIKKISLIVLASLISLGLSAEDISEEQARQIAVQFWGDSTPSTARRAAASLLLTYQPEGSEFYVFNRPGGDGWVIVAGDNGASPTILAYSDKGSFDYNKSPDATKTILTGYTKSIQDLRQSGISESIPSKAPKRAAIIVAPLLKTSWNQNTPYNNQCPTADEGGGRCPTGCVATAIAQIMNYWQWPKQGYGKHTNTDNNETRDFSQSTYDWDNMLDSYSDYTEVQANAVAQLMADVGCAMNMMYRSSDSGTLSIDAAQALLRNFSYSGELHMHHMMDKKGIKVNNLTAEQGSEIDEDDEALIRSELASKRPIYMGVSSNLYREKHAVVCDGYDADDYFHINFGWGSDADGFYRLNSMGTFGEYVSSELITNIKPSPYGNSSACVNGVWYTANGSEQVFVTGAEKQDVTITNQVEIGGKSRPVNYLWSSAFRETDLTNLTFPGTIKTIPEQAFYGCTQLETADLEGVTHIGKEAFVYNDHLRYVSLGDALQEVGERAFYDCRSLTSCVNFPATLRLIDKEAFSSTRIGCVIFAGKGFEIEEGGLNSNSKFSATGLEKAARLHSHSVGGLIGDFIISSTCQYDESAVTGEFDHIILSKKLKKYDPSIFGLGTSAAEFAVKKGNSNYVSVNSMLLTKDLKTLVAFPCYEISDRQLIKRDLAYIPAGITKIEEHAFSNGPSIVQIPASVKQMDGAFTNCGSLRHLYMLGSTPPVINDEATFTPSINEYGSSCKLYVPHGSKETYQQANVWKNFENIDDSELYLQGPLCYSISGDEWANVADRNSEATFDGHITIPGTVTIDGKQRHVVQIEGSAFWGDTQLKTVTITKDVMNNGSAFIGCTNLYAFNVAAGNTNMHSTDGMLFYSKTEYLGNALTVCPPMQQTNTGIVERTQIVVPGETEWIGTGAPVFSSNMKRITIPAGVTRISYDAFKYCTNLKTIICQGTTPPIYDDGGEPFPTSLLNTTTVYVPKGCTETYRQGWPYRTFADFKNIVEYDPANPNIPAENPDDPEEPDEPDIPADEGTVTSLILLLKDGTTQTYELAEQPVITVVGTELKIVANHADVSIPLTDVVRYTFQKRSTTGIDEVDTNQEVIDYKDGVLTLSGLEAGTPISLYTIDGRLLQAHTVADDGTYRQSLASLRQGVYVVKVNHKSYKIMKR
jgi:hypothetical protein